MQNKRLLCISDRNDSVTEKIIAWVTLLSAGKITVKRINYENEIHLIKIDPVFVASNPMGLDKILIRQILVNEYAIYLMQKEAPYGTSCND